MTISGEATKAQVAGLASFRAAKLRLKLVMMEFRSPFWMSWRFHWPMQGPQALASTMPPTAVKIAICPSRSMVARICSLPGVMVKVDLAFAPWSSACFATLAARSMSS